MNNLMTKQRCFVTDSISLGDSYFTYEVTFNPINPPFPTPEISVGKPRLMRRANYGNNPRGQGFFLIKPRFSINRPTSVW